MPNLKTALKPDAQLLLSGLMVQDEKDIVDACSKHALKLSKKAEQGEWLSLLFINSK